VRVAERLRLHAGGCRQHGSPFYAELMERMAHDVEADGPVAALLGPYDGEPFDAVHQLRLLGGVHRMVLTGDAPALAAHYPSVGGNGDAEAAWPALRELLATRPPVVLDALTRPPQTNEVGRCAPLVGGFLVVARDTGLPLRALELGASAGLNLRFDRYWYRAGEASFGDPSSPVRFENRWEQGTPPLETRARVVDRRGCDRDPIDATTDDGRLTLLAYVWPDQTERFELLRAALEIAKGFPAPVDRAEIPVWVRGQLSQPVVGVATVVFHSIVWGYLDDREQAEVRATLERAGERASPEAPLAWLRLERDPAFANAELRLTTWPGGAERLLARSGFHVGPVTWLG
jgi:hypothetical protein